MVKLLQVLGCSTLKETKLTNFTHKVDFDAQLFGAPDRITRLILETRPFRVCRFAAAFEIRSRRICRTCDSQIRNAVRVRTEYFI